MPTNKVRLTLELTLALNDELQAIADAEGITKSEVFRRAFMLYTASKAEVAAGHKIPVTDKDGILLKEFIGI